MHPVSHWIGLLCLLALVGCGNANDGKSYKTTSSSNVQGSSAQTNLTSAMNHLRCHSSYSMSNKASFNELYANSVLCPSQGPIAGSKGYSVRLKVGAAVPPNTRLCLIPFVGNAVAPETCFAIDRQADVMLSTGDYTNAVLLPEASLAAYRSYMSSDSTYSPPRLFFTL